MVATIEGFHCVWNEGGREGQGKMKREGGERMRRKGMRGGTAMKREKEAGKEGGRYSVSTHGHGNSKHTQTIACNKSTITVVSIYTTYNTAGTELH